MRAPRLRLTATAGLAALALLGVAPCPDTDAPPAAVNPEILAVTFSPAQLRAGKPFEVTIRTTPDITALQACVLKYKLTVPKESDGVFSAAGKVPWWARIYHGTFHVTFVGYDASGDEAQMEADVHI